jgi:hypothetical protein
MADFQIATAILRQRLRKTELDGLVGLGRQLFKLFSQIRARPKDKPTDALAVSETDAVADSDDFVVGVLAMAIAFTSADRPLQDLPVQRWQSDASSVEGDGAGIVRFCDHVSELLRDDRFALALTRDETAPVQSRLAAAVFLAVSAGTPDELFLATATLVTGYAGAVWRRDVEKAIEVLVSRGWRDMVRDQRFALRAPTLVAPAVEAACGDGSVTGLTKCARIVLAAHPGTSVRVAPEALEALRRLGRV